MLLGNVALDDPPDQVTHQQGHEVIWPAPIPGSVAVTSPAARCLLFRAFLVFWDAVVVVPQPADMGVLVMLRRAPG